MMIKKDIMERRDEKYYLMHGEKVVCAFDFYGKVKVIDKKYMPYSLYVEEKGDVDTCTNNVLNIIHFLSNRIISLDRKYSKVIYNFLGLPQTSDERIKANFAIRYHALSLTDVYWVKKCDENIKYKDINLYENSKTNVYVDIFLRGKYRNIDKKSFDTKDTSTSGMCAKAWVKDEKKNIFYLYKDGNIVDVKNEILASKIVECFKVNAVRYEKGIYESKEISKCEIITNKRYSLLNFMDLDIYCQNNDMDVYDYIKKIDAYNYYMMHIIDYLIGNDDRHVNNWGVLIDNNTNKIIRLYDLMDFNKAFRDYKNIDGGISQTVRERLTRREVAMEAVNKVGLNMIKSINKKIWKDNNTKMKMFYKRLEILKNACQKS